MTESERFERVLRDLAQAEIDDQVLHGHPSSLDESVRSHDRLTRLRSEAARLRKDLGVAAPRVRRRRDGIHVFPDRR